MANIMRAAQEGQKSKTSNTCEKHIEGCRVGAEDWPVQNCELSKDFYFCELSRGSMFQCK